MISFELSETQRLLRGTVREFAEAEIAPRIRELDDREQFSVELTQQMAALGLFGMSIPAEYGGGGLDTLSYIIAVEELARIDASCAITVAAGNSLGTNPIYYFGTEAQRREWLPRLCSGEALACFGLTEPGAGSDAGATQTRAILKNGHWEINGSKLFITNSTNPLAKVVVLQVVSGSGEGGRKEYSCILVQHGTAGFKVKPIKGKMLWRSSDTGELTFENCRVPESNLLGDRGSGFHQMLKTLDAGRLSIAAMGLGGAQGAYELALRYAKEREQFGRPIVKHQAVAFKLADMATEIEAGRWLLYRACWLKDQQRSFSKEAAMAKLFCSEMMGRVVDQAVQIHGGYGLVKEFAVERFYRDHKILEIGEGTSEIQRLVISRHLES